jgi:hypothetical protein
MGVNRKLTFLLFLSAVYLSADFLYALCRRETGNVLYEAFRVKKMRSQRSAGPQRILLSGGSNAVWGYRSAILEKEMSIPTTNLALPSEGHDPKVMRKLLLDVIRRGDIAVYSSISLWNLSVINDAAAQDLLRAAGLSPSSGFRERIFQTLSSNFSLSPPRHTLAFELPRLYQRYIGQQLPPHYLNTYNEYGDLKSCNKVPIGPQPFTPSADQEAQLAALRDLQREVEERGARLIIDLSWLYVSKDEKSLWMKEYEPFFRALKTEFTVATGALDSVLLTDDELFCDTVNHLSDEGAVQRTVRLALFLKKELTKGDEDMTLSSGLRNRALVRKRIQ